MKYEKLPWRRACLCVTAILFIYGVALMGTKRWKWIFNNNNNNNNNNTKKENIIINENWDGYEYKLKPKNLDNPLKYCFDCLHDLSLGTLKFLLYGMVMSKTDICDEIKHVGNKNKPGGYSVCFSGNLKSNISCRVLSFGISNDWSFDEGMSEHNCYVHSFDPSMGLEDHMHRPKIKFHNLALGEYDHVNEFGWEVKEIMSILRSIGWDNEAIDVIKFDAEGSEWLFLEDMIKHEVKVKQIILEIHSMTANTHFQTKDHLIYMIGLFRRLKSKGYKVWKGSHVYSCCNYYSPLLPEGFIDKCCYEVYLYNTRYY